MAPWTKSATSFPWARAAFSAALATALWAWGACEPKIGDSCSANVDCAIDGTRVCDKSSPGGYCTVPGCEADSCPDDSVCVGFFPVAFATVSCNPLTEDLACDPCVPGSGDCNALCGQSADTTACQPCDPSNSDACNAHCDPGPATDDCGPEEVCLWEGVCVRRDAERRYCMATCGSDDDCRDGYECRKTGRAGAELVPKTGEPYTGEEKGFCAPKP